MIRTKKKQKGTGIDTVMKVEPTRTTNRIHKQKVRQGEKRDKENRENSRKIGIGDKNNDREYENIEYIGPGNLLNSHVRKNKWRNRRNLLL